MYKVIYTIIGIGVGFFINLFLAGPGIIRSDILIIAIWVISTIIGFIVGLSRDNEKKAMHKSEKEHQQNAEAGVVKIMNTEFYKWLIGHIRERNRIEYPGMIESSCTYEKKPEVSMHFLAFPTLEVESKYIKAKERINFSDHGLRDLTDMQREVLAKALSQEPGYKISGHSKYCVEADFSYWKPILQRRIDEVYDEKVREYKQTYKELY